MQSHLIAPSILSANFAHLGDDVKKVLAAGADIIHFDVMDNHYVPNLTFGPMICEALRNDGIDAIIDVHLMVEPVDAMVDMFADAGANWISFHPEASKHVDRTLELIKSRGCNAGLVLNPATSLEHIEHVIDRLDHVLLMSVNPGFGGQSFIPSILNKIRKLQEMITLSGRDIRIQIDGGVKVDNIRAIAEAGASIFVAGSAIFNQPDYQQAITQMREQLAAVNN